MSKTLLNSIDRAQIRGLLMERASSKLLNDSDPDSDREKQFMAVARGIVSEVAFVVSDPPPPEKADRAVWCISLGIAASLESSALPNQQLNGESRAEVLRTRYLSVKAELGGTATGPGSTPAPLYTFPAPQPWPETRRW